MNPTPLGRALARAEQLIDRERHPRRRLALRSDLLDALAVRRPPSGRLREVIPHALLRPHRRRLDYLSAALHAVTAHGLAPAHAARISSVHATEVEHALRIAARCGLRPSALAAMADDGVRAAVDAATMSLVVELSPNALTDLIAAAVESYLAPPRGSEPKEMYATAFGSTTIGAFDEKHERHVHTYVTRFALHHHAKATPTSVTPSARAEAAHRLVVKELFNDGSVLVGEAHSHPARSWSDLLRDRAWMYSQQDQDHCRAWQHANVEREERAFFSIVVAVASAALTGTSIVRVARNRYRVRLAKSIGLMVACYRIQSDGDLDSRATVQFGA